ncbi:MAG: hypothetical protein Q6360_11835 [Candidatus Brocadiales bacterium]|nr:hypothetical protein [Candidatus Brocadiales bacterium]
MAVLLNKKKVVSICPVNILKSVCPSIQKTRQIRRELLTASKVVTVGQKRLESLRERLRERRIKGISVDCQTCKYNKQTAE